MTLTATIMMFVILAVLWGGFALTLRIAMRKEAEKAGK